MMLAPTLPVSHRIVPGGACERPFYSDFRAAAMSGRERDAFWMMTTVAIIELVAILYLLATR